MDSASARKLRLSQRSRQRNQLVADPILGLWRRLINTAVADASKTMQGVATYEAVLARWWIEEYRPTQEERDAWGGSFECACSWLGLDVNEERKLMSKRISAGLMRSAVRFSQEVSYVRRAHMLSCMGKPTAIGKQLVLGLVDADEYDSVMGIDTPEKQARPDASLLRRMRADAQASPEARVDM